MGSKVNFRLNPIFWLIMPAMLVFRPLLALVGLLMLYIVVPSRAAAENAKSETSFTAFLSAEDLWNCALAQGLSPAC